MIILDLGILNNEFINVKPKKNMDRMFEKNSIIDHLISDKSNFRVFPADEITSNKYSYWNVESIGGYRPIKLRRTKTLWMREDLIVLIYWTCLMLNMF